MNDMNDKKIKLLLICGPTGSGKSALAVGLAREFRGCVISCDAMQVYRGMDVGTGKITEEEMRGVPHRMIDILEPSTPFSLSDFIERATKEIADALAAGFLPVLCGGTGLYADRLLDGTSLSDAPGDPALRAELDRLSSEELYEELSRVDPDAAAATHPNNRKRVIRALEICRLTGETKSAWDARSHESESPYDVFRIYLKPRDRQTLYAAIDARVDKMFENGLEAEARALFAGDPAPSAAQAIGYKEFLPYFDGAEELRAVKEKIKQASRNYAKRQLTWFSRAEEESLVIDASLPEEEKLSAARAAVAEFIK